MPPPSAVIDPWAGRATTAVKPMPLPPGIVDPWADKLSGRRAWLVQQLNTLLPDNTRALSSIDKDTKEFFENWTGQTQVSLENAWQTKQDFHRAKDAEEAKRGVWVSDTGAIGTTSCEGMVKRAVQKLSENGFNKNKPFDSFNLPGFEPKGKEPAKAVGWHWYKDKTATVHPQPGDFFQIGVPLANGRWSIRHVGIIIAWIDGENPIWTTVEAGQGGPSRGFDLVKRKGPRPVDPIDPAVRSKVLMGWLDLDEFFDGWKIPPQTDGK